MDKRIAAALRLWLLPSHSSITQRCINLSTIVLAMVTSPKYLPQSCTNVPEVTTMARLSF
jgi:hypothetical protein